MESSKEIEFQKRLLATFKVEAEEHLNVISAGLLKLEKTTDLKEASGIIETISREAHSLKGASRAVNQGKVEAVCRAIEDVITHIKQKELQLDTGGYDTLHKSLDLMKSILNVSINGEGNESVVNADLVECLGEIESLVKTEKESEDEFPGAIPEKNLHGPDEPKVYKEKTENKQVKDTVRIPVSKLDSILHQTEELISVRLKMNQHALNLNQFRSELDDLKTYLGRQKQLVKKQLSTATNGGNTDHQKFNEGSTIIISKALTEYHNRITSSEVNLSDLLMKFEQDQKSAGSDFNGLMNDVRDLLLLPFDTILELFPKLVRDLSRDQGKKVILNISGAGQEIDRRILELLKDPLIHIVRNCIDHGIEKPEDRISSNKDESGIIDITIAPISSNLVELTISDDGMGIDLKEVGRKAIKSGHISKQELSTMSEGEIREILFQSGFSTSRMITDISGRGLGMTIVREKVEQIGGNLSVESEKEKGTTIRLILPLSFGTFRGVNILVGNQEFVIPARHIEIATRIARDSIKTIENKEVIKYNDDTLNVIYLENLLGLEGEKDLSENRYPNVLILKSGSRKIAAIVSSIVEELEILIKPFAEPLRRIKYFEGVTILRSGKITPVLNVQDIFRMIDRGLAKAVRPSGKAAHVQSKPSVLVAEDSMTARMLLKDILESAGYEVKTAVDGVEAMKFLQEDDYQLLVSDVEMPGMDGFELTGKIRKNNNLRELPVILVTALKSPEDRERGMEAGANAYIEKGKFEPQNLLDIVEKLI